MDSRMIGWFMALCAPAACAQQVQVYADGKPVAVADAANAGRAPIKDERRARRPLAERPDAQTIAKAHAAAVLRCGLDESAYPPEVAPTPQELAYFVGHNSYLPVTGTGDIMVMGEYLRGKVVVDPSSMTVQTPQCPAGVAAMYWSASARRVLFTTQPVTGMAFPGGSRLLWTASYGKMQDIWQYNAGAQGPRFHKLLSLPNEKVSDMFVPDSGEVVWVLSHTTRSAWRAPRTWLRALRGKPAREMDIVLRQIDGQGRVLSVVPVASGVLNGYAHFVRE
ncbi:hypothetical protein KY495_22245 [Massilia sp. PAMC28688]|uniref:hypothetical protein n=1 Tax=Massilia sp. PAMC28688 TaxID=2861283 RepID=UPI001C63547E|nr:hypothetical protein [Massilia sp. PAMC28688]QYF93359.1 hypothetical protein KY495_22245 [Massilia sp. PAMC28688]